jgi:hypothetical protein
VPDTNDWLQRRALNRFDAWGEWTIIGNQMLIWPTMGVGVTATFAYLDKNCVALASAATATVSVADGDSFALDERVLKLGMIWQWKAQKGSPYAEDMGTYGDALTIAMGNDSPAPIIVGRKPISSSSTGRCLPVAGADAMSHHQAFRRVPVPPQAAQVLQTVDDSGADARPHLRARTKRYMQPGAAVVMRQLDTDHARRQAARRLHQMVRAAGDARR